MGSFMLLNKKKNCNLSKYQLKLQNTTIFKVHSWQWTPMRRFKEKLLFPAIIIMIRLLEQSTSQYIVLSSDFSQPINYLDLKKKLSTDWVEFNST